MRSIFYDYLCSHNCKDLKRIRSIDYYESHNRLYNKIIDIINYVNT